MRSTRGVVGPTCSRSALRVTGPSTLGSAWPLLSCTSYRQKRGCATAHVFDVAEQRALLEEIGKQLGVKELSDWYTIPRRDITRKGGWRLAKVYPSFPAALKALYPDFPWDFYRFTRKSRKRDYAYNLTRQRAFLEDIGKQLGVQQLSDWYSFSRLDVESKGGALLFHHYSSLGEALSALYPEFKWDPLLLKQPPKGFWNEKANVFKAISMAERQLGVETPEDWYSITMSDLREVGFPYKFPRAKVVELLVEKYPNIDWRGWLLKGRYSLQKRLEKTVISLFPEEELKVNVRKEAGLTLPGTTSNYLELDLFLPELHLAFEFQEKHHYVDTNYTYHPVEFYARRDRLKKDLAKANGISLITVPYWWDGTKERLIATIQKMRPDILPDEEGTGEGIPEEMPPHFLAEVKPPHIEDIGEPQNACFFTLTSVDPTNWWLFEKYDGIRGFWNPLKKAFYSRQGKVLVLPQSIIDDMPDDTFLEGEIWFGVDTFQEVMKIVNRVNEDDIDWDKFRFMVFDLPKLNAPYATRYNQLEKLLTEKNCKYAKVAPKEECKGVQHLEEFFQGVMDRGGEGIILRDPTSLYEPGRSSGYLKHKKFRDAEARIIEPEGHNSWKCEMADGTIFTANASTDFAKRWQPKAGDIVSFKHHGFLLSSKKPKLPMIYRLRTDIPWEHVVRNWKEKKSSPSFRPLRSSLERRPKGYWLDVNNRRKFFIDFAKEKGFDALDPYAWTKVSTVQISASKGNALLAVFKGSLKKALLRTFPELKFPFSPEDAKGYWRDATTRRDFLMEVARELNFDPLHLSNWASVLPEHIAEKNGVGLLKLYGGSIWKAIADTFPEFGIEKKANKKRARVAEPVGQHMRIGNFY